MSIKLVLIHSAVLILSYILFHRKYDKFGVFGIDVFRWVYYALELKSKKYKWPLKITGYLDNKPLNYPPLYIYFLSFFPKTVILKKPHYLQQILFLLEYVSLFLFINFRFEITLLQNLILALAFTSFSFKKYNYISSRPLGYLLTALYIIVLNFITLYNLYFILALCILIYTIILFSHRFSIQFILVTQVTLSLVTTNSVINDITSAIIISQFGVILLSKSYRKIFLNHYSILTYYFEGININADWEIKPPKLHLKSTFNTILYSLPFIFHFIYLLLNDISLSVNSYVIVIGLNFAILMNISTLRFWGEPNRILDYLLFPLVIDMMRGGSEYIYILSAILIIQFLASSVFRRKSNLYFHLNTAKNDRLSEKLSAIFENRPFNFMSYPAIFDDYVKLKHQNAKVFFHDNGLALKYNPIKYKPEFVELDLETTYLTEIHENLNVNCFMIHKDHEYLVNDLFKNYPDKFSIDSTDGTELEDFLLIYE